MDLDLYTDTLVNSLYSSGSALTSLTLSRLRLNISVVEYNSTITEVVRRAYNHTYVIPCVSIQTYSTLFTTSTAGVFTWAINASLKNAKGLLFSFRDSNIQGTGNYNLSNRTSLAMTQAQLSVGQYTFPANRYLLYDCGTAVDTQGTLSSTYYGYANQVNFWMSAMKFFGLGIDRLVLLDKL